MRVVLWVYLILYGLVVGGAAVTVWRSGLSDHLDRAWTVAIIAAALLLGVLLALVSGLFSSARRPPPQADAAPRD